jgi:protein arginine N-methyltransferase 1
LLTPSLRVNEGDNVNVSFSMVRSKENHRLMDMEFTYELQESSGKKLPAISTKIFLE